MVALYRRFGVRGEWIANAFLKSFSATLWISVAIGLVYVPYDRWRHHSRQRVTVLDCHLSEDSQQVISLVGAHTGGMTEGRQVRLTCDELAISRPTAEIQLRGLQPCAMVATGDQRRLLVATTDGGIYSIDPSQPSGERTLLGKCESPVEWMELSADESLLITLSFRSIDAWDVERQCLAWKRSDLAATCFAICSETRLTCGTQQGEVFELDLHWGQMTQTVARRGASICHVAVNHDQSMLAVESSGQATLFHRPREKAAWRARPTGNMYTGNRRMSFTPDGRYVVGTSRSNHIMLVWDVERQQQIRGLMGHRAPILGAAFRPDGTLLSWGTDGSIFVWEMAAHAAFRVVAQIRPRVAG